MSETLENRAKCPYCGGAMTSGGRFCQYCGRDLTADQQEQAAQQAQAQAQMDLQTQQAQQDLQAQQQAQADAQSSAMAASGAVPKTIADLQAWAAVRHLPLARMRFFVGENRREPKAFVIYEEEPGRYTVAKNKADGSRAVRYSGPDEAYAVKEIYLKLLDECHRRGLYPDRAGGSDAGTNPDDGTTSFLGAGAAEKPASRATGKSKLTTILIIGAVILFVLYGVSSCRGRRQNGYYQQPDGSVYYSYDGSAYVPGVANWFLNSAIGGASDVFLGSDYSSGYGVSDFQQSDTWHDIQDSHDSDSSSWFDSDYDSWDMDFTDWGSDW